jgi:hypothetical protein
LAKDCPIPAEWPVMAISMILEFSSIIVVALYRYFELQHHHYVLTTARVGVDKPNYDLCHGLVQKLVYWRDLVGSIRSLLSIGLVVLAFVYTA